MGCYHFRVWSREDGGRAAVTEKIASDEFESESFVQQFLLSFASDRYIVREIKPEKIFCIFLKEEIEKTGNWKNPVVMFQSIDGVEKGCGCVICSQTLL